ncbi:MAG: hypothetical protein GX913_01130 [Clostridiales bacterium]|nr:hypothetical protein [Clostridiales bacterium]
MKNSVIQKHIRIISFKRMFYPFLLIVITVYIFQQIPFYNTLRPKKIDHVSEIEAAFKSDNHFIDLNMKKLYYSGYNYLENGKISGSYYYAIEDGTCYYFLLAEDSFDNRGEVLKDFRMRGKIEAGGENLNNLISNMAKDLSWTSSELRKASSPLLIKEVEYLQSKTIWLLGINFTIFFISCFLFLYALSFIIVPLLHPSCIFLRRYGRIRQQVAELEDELEGQIHLRCKNLIVTKNYLVEISNTHLKILPLSQILWAYKHSNFHQFRLFSNKLTYTLRVVGKRSGKLVSTLQPKSDVDMVLKYLEVHFPEVLVGYSKENEKTAKKKNWI